MNRYETRHVSNYNGIDHHDLKPSVAGEFPADDSDIKKCPRRRHVELYGVG